MTASTGRMTTTATSKEKIVDEYRFDCQSCGKNVASTERHTADDCAAHVREADDDASPPARETTATASRQTRDTPPTDLT